ncbi:MAG: hypothetical protein DHS20C20_14970 [Ardenticatenaceae bacterium]|nr:MAG: hypothetical protein DHS20C20_14970 [Ardenticatenaceae bacterium]
MISHATIIGRTHRLMQRNCQDFAATASPTPHIAIGIVCDGCGSKFRENGRFQPSHNETGANLLGQFSLDFLCQKLAVLPQPICSDAVEKVLSDLHLAALAFLHHLAVHFPEARRREFIATRLLTTLVGFVRTPETAVFFWQGDGFLMANGRIQPLNSHNQPDYLAYQLLQPKPEPASFKLACVPQPETLKWLAVATDGWSNHLLDQLAEPRSPLTLQRWLNVQSQQRGQFDDDGAIAIWHEK